MEVFNVEHRSLQQQNRTATIPRQLHLRPTSFLHVPQLVQKGLVGLGIRVIVVCLKNPLPSLPAKPASGCWHCECFKHYSVILYRYSEALDII